MTCYYNDPKATAEVLKDGWLYIYANAGGVTIKNDRFTMPDSSVEIKAIFEKDASPAPTEHTVTVKTDGSGTASASPAKAAAGTEITLTATPNAGYHFREWQVISGSVTIKDGKFTMPDGNVEVMAKFTAQAKPIQTTTPQETAAPQSAAQPKPTVQPTVQPAAPIPATGDAANPLLWLVMLIVSGIAMAAVFVIHKKNSRK